MLNTPEEHVLNQPYTTTILYQLDPNKSTENNLQTLVSRWQKYDVIANSYLVLHKYIHVCTHEFDDCVSGKSKDVRWRFLTASNTVV